MWVGKISGAKMVCVAFISFVNSADIFSPLELNFRRADLARGFGTQNKPHGLKSFLKKQFYAPLRFKIKQALIYCMVKRPVSKPFIVLLAVLGWQAVCQGV